MKANSAKKRFKVAYLKSKINFTNYLNKNFNIFRYYPLVHLTNTFDQIPYTSISSSTYSHGNFI